MFNSLITHFRPNSLYLISPPVDHIVGWSFKSFRFVVFSNQNEYVGRGFPQRPIFREDLPRGGPPLSPRFEEDRTPRHPKRRRPVVYYILTPLSVLLQKCLVRTFVSYSGGRCKITGLGLLSGRGVTFLRPITSDVHSGSPFPFTKPPLIG